MAETSGETNERIGAYRVVRRLATGGTSDVLLAKAEGPHGFERTVVLKVLLSHFGKDDEVSKMFAREASAYARLSHPHIVRLFDFFAVPAADPKKGGQLVMVLEYVDGPPLARLKSMAKAIGKELDDRASIYIAACIFDALAAAHSAVDDAQIPAPVIHRDVNPSNVLIQWDGFPKLADFGVAKVTGLGHHSVVGMIKGTYGYMSPEQVTGQEAVTPRSDVYAAAIILWELLTKRRAFQRGALPEVEALRAMAEPRLPALESIRSDVDRTVREALRRALEPRAEKRKITAEEMVSILTAVVPPEQGRERLMSMLGLVRNDARAVNAQASVAPPPMPPAGPRSESLLPDVVIPGAPKMAPDFGPHTVSGVAPPPTQQGLAPRTRATPPRPVPSSAKMAVGTPVSSAKIPVAPPAPPLKPPGSSGKLPAAPSSGKLPTGTLSSASGLPAVQVPGDAKAREVLPTRPVMPAVTPPVVTPPTALSPPLAPPPPPIRPVSRPGLPAVAGPVLPPPEAPPRTKSAASRLAGSVPPDSIDPAAPRRPLSSLLEGIGEAMGPQHPAGPFREPAMSSPPDSPRVAAPLKDLTGGLGLRDAIDEIMKGVPGSQQRVPAATPAPGAPRDSDKPQTRETKRAPAGMTSTLIGLIPPAPPPMMSSGFPTSVVDSDRPTANPNDIITTPPGAVTPSSGPRSPDDFPFAADDPSEAPRDTTVVTDPAPLTPRMQTAPNPMAQTLAMESRPMPVAPSQPTPRFTPAPMQAVPIPEPLPTSSAPSGVSHPQYAQPSTPAPSHRPPKKGAGVGTVAVALVVVIALGIAGTVAFVRYQAHRELADAGAYVPPARPTASAVSAVASNGAEPPSSASPAVVPPPSVDAAVATAPSDAGATPTAAGDAAAPSEPIEEGMGQIKTPGTYPGRRIFVDDKVAGQTPNTVVVKCGTHKVRLGSTGLTQEIDVPCSGEIVVGDK